MTFGQCDQIIFLKNRQQFPKNRQFSRHCSKIAQNGIFWDQNLKSKKSENRQNRFCLLHKNQENWGKLKNSRFLGSWRFPAGIKFFPPTGPRK